MPRAIQKSGYIRPSKVYGKLIEDRGSQISFSALGQDIVAILGKRGVALKEKWRKENTPLKLRIVKILQRMLPEFEVRAAGYTTIDITRKGIDKAYGVRQIRKKLGVSIKKWFLWATRFSRAVMTMRRAKPALIVSKFPDQKKRGKS